MSRQQESQARTQQRADDEINWGNLSRRIQTGQVIPIISNAVQTDRIFDLDGDNVPGIGTSRLQANPLGWSIEDEIADAWAASDEVKFPLPEQHWLPRVALYDRVVNSEGDYDAKTRYLGWLKNYLLTIAEEYEVSDSDTIADLRDDLDRNSFSDIAVELGLPRVTDDSPDPIEQLAKLGLPIYITTSPFDFLERAIRADKREPRTQVCYWSGTPPVIDPALETDYDFRPSRATPLVFHLFGLEEFPETIVLHEDDYLDFLFAVLRDADQRLVPSYLFQSIAQSDLILLGYRLRDWDLRVMFRGLLNTPAKLRKMNLAIQMDPARIQSDELNEKIKAYLLGYFDESTFKVAWGSPQDFVRRLAEEYEKWIRGNRAKH